MSQSAGIEIIAVGMAAGRAYVGRGAPARQAMLILSVISLLPDLDFIGFRMGVPYEDPWGHRGGGWLPRVANDPGSEPLR